MASISVITPFFNAERYIERCVQSLLKQTLDNIELIFIDDNSTDRSVSILRRELANNDLSRFASVTVLSNDEKLGVSESRRRGVAAATGEYIGWVDADDWVEPDAFEKMYELAIRDHADIIVSNSVWHFTDREKYMDYKHNSEPEEALKKMYDHRYLPYQLWSHLIKSEIIKKSIESIFPTDYGEDFYTLVHAYYYSDGIAYLDDYVYHYENRNPDSIMHTMEYSYPNWLQQKKNIQIISRLLYSGRGGHFSFHKAVNQVKFNRKNKFRASFTSLRDYYYTFDESYKDIIKQENFKPHLKRSTKYLRFSFFPFYWLHYHKTNWRTDKYQI